MSVSLQRLEGVQTAKVTLNQGRAAIALAPGNKVTWVEIRERVKRNGFTPQGATVTVRARVIAAGGRFRLEVPETKETFDTAATSPAGTPAELKKHVGQIVTVEGSIAAPKDKAAAAIDIRNIRADTPQR